MQLCVFDCESCVKNEDLGKNQANFFPTTTVSLGSIPASWTKNSQHKTYPEVLGIINNFFKYSSLMLYVVIISITYNIVFGIKLDHTCWQQLGMWSDDILKIGRHNLAFDINTFHKDCKWIFFSNSRHVHIIGTESLHLLLHYGKKKCLR